MARILAVLALLTACGAPEDGPRSWAVSLVTRDEHPAMASVIEQRLRGRDPLDAAWGAYLAGEHGSAATRDYLLGMLQDEPLVQDTALDALARMGASVPDELLRSIPNLDARTVMAVALQEPEAHRDLIFASFATDLPDLASLIADNNGELAHFRGHANALAWLRDREFAAALFGSLEATISASVFSPSEDGRGMGCHCGATMRGQSSCYGGFAFNALPPIGSWSIRAADDDDCVVLLPGPTDVCLARRQTHAESSMMARALSGEPLRAWVSALGHDSALRIVDDYGSTILDSFDDFDAQDEDAEPLADEHDEDFEPAADEVDASTRAACPASAVAQPTEVEPEPSELNDELLAYLSAVADREVKLDGRLAVRYTWTGDAEYRAFMASLRDGLRTAHADLARSLADTYVLPSGYRPRRLHVSFDISDLRDCGVSGPLPKL